MQDPMIPGHIGLKGTYCCCAKQVEKLPSKYLVLQMTLTRKTSAVVNAETRAGQSAENKCLLSAQL